MVGRHQRRHLGGALREKRNELISEFLDAGPSGCSKVAVVPR